MRLVRNTNLGVNANLCVMLNTDDTDGMDRNGLRPFLCSWEEEVHKAKMKVSLNHEDTKDAKLHEVIPSGLCNERFNSFELSCIFKMHKGRANKV